MKGLEKICQRVVSKYPKEVDKPKRIIRYFVGEMMKKNPRYSPLKVNKVITNILEDLTRSDK